MSLNNFSLGFISSLCAAAFVPFFIDIWNKIIAPFFQNSFYRGRRVKGNWKAEAIYTEDGEDKKDEEFVKLCQSGCKVSGTMTSTVKGDHTVYIFKGELINSIVTASYWKDGKDDIFDRGTIILKMIDDKLLKGSFTCCEENNVLTGFYCWKKV